MDNQALASEIADCISGLSNPLRVRILLALAATREPDWSHRGLSYAELRDRLAVEDGGRLNYHLDELREQFITSEDGHYSLTSAGTHIVGEMHAGTFTEQHDPAGGQIDYGCTACGEQLTATIEGGVISVTCPDHGERYDMTLPFSAVDRHSLTELYEIARQRAWRYIGTVRSDVCPHCGNCFAGPTVEHVVDSPDSASGREPKETDGSASDDTSGGEGRSLILLDFVCDGCGVAFKLPVWTFALHCLPAIVFFADHGFDVRNASLYHATDEWSQDAYETETTFVVQFEMHGDCLELELDQSLTIVDYERNTL